MDPLLELAAGLAGAPAVRVVVPEDRHITVDFAARLLGFGVGNLRPVACDDPARVIPAELERELAHAHDAWVHVDGAFGLWAGASERRALAGGVDQADSWATDGDVDRSAAAMPAQVGR